MIERIPPQNIEAEQAVLGAMLIKKEAVGRLVAQHLVDREGIGDKVSLGGTFCMGKCQQGVCVTVDDEFFSVSPETVDDFFEKEIGQKVK